MKRWVSYNSKFAIQSDFDASVCVVFSDRSSPKEIRITQEIEGSGQAMIDWSFPKNCPALSRFCISATNEGEGRVVCQKSVTSQERRVTIDSLQPSTKYTVNVMAEYSDGIEKRRIKEHVNCGMLSHMIKYDCLCMYYTILLPEL